MVAKRIQSGFTFLALLIFLALIAMASAATAELWHVEMKRERERELLFVGDQFRRAIELYSGKSQQAAGRYPHSLDELLKDPRYPDTRRYLRKIYRDPVTGSDEWGLVKGPNGEIYGVYSLSEAEPLQKHHFAYRDRNFDGMSKYSDWVFMPSVLVTRILKK